MSVDWLNLSGGQGDSRTVVDRLMESPYGELVEIDAINDRCRNLVHTEGRFFVPVMEGSWRELYRYCAEHMVHPADRLVFEDTLSPDALQDRLEKAEIPGVVTMEARYRGVDGEWLWTLQVLVCGARNGLPDGIIYNFMFDIDAQKRREAGGAFARAAGIRRDDLTGLLLEQDFFALAQRKLSGLAGQWCVIAVDIENFRLFCDWHSQQTGRFLLAEIGEILLRVEQDTGGLAGYRGQDDFSLLMPYDIRRIDALYDELQRLIVSKGNSVGFLPAFGICMVERPDEQVMELFNRAALTAEQIKGDFRNRIRVYNPALQQKQAEEYDILSHFQRALADGEVFFVLQPQCRVSTACVVGAESLARWRAADGRMIPPARFVPILEKYGMVTNLDRFIWEGVCAWLRRWIDAGHTPVPISVNVSQIDIFTVDVPRCLEELLAKYRLPTGLIKIEITESAYVEDTAVVRETVRRLRSLGFMVLMDDFGSGYSSLNMLRSLNVDAIKLDAQFLRISQNESRKGISIVESIVSMAKTMGLPIVVEGVETQEQVSFLSDLGCRYIQGYYFYRPMPVEDFENLIRDGRRVDLHGLEMKGNEQFHTREFLDVNVVNDVMLNNILGPVCIYRWKGDAVDIIRYNQQFYRMVGIELGDMNRRLSGIQNFIFPEDREKMYDMLARALRDRLNGASGVVRVYKPSGALCWIALQMYYLDENEQGRLFFASARDVTETQYINADIPGGYYRCAVDGDYAFMHVSQGFEDLVGFTAAELRERFDNRFAKLVHPEDLPALRARVEAIRRGETPKPKPFRLQRRDGGYIYTMNQARMTDLSGQLCFQGVAIDVTNMVKLRNQMRLLSRFSSDDVIFVRRKGEGMKHQVVVHGLENRLGLSRKAFERLLNSGEAFRRVPDAEAGALKTALDAAVERREHFEYDFSMALEDGTPVPLHIKIDSANDRKSKVGFIVILRER